MELTEEQYRRILELLPKQRGNAKTENLTVLSALVYICRNGCSWRALPEKFGKRHAVYVRFNRRAKAARGSRSPPNSGRKTQPKRGVFRWIQRRLRHNPALTER
ncbi:transposase [Treponema endosymbiont of Eucomonympha sp.]|uniref:transposase n=1 Tax=Treponema endosymbiont of Eucomonympha sp. TaxID=1580831 RepID=UPI000784BA09|nr:transposase [Treponema endosymbiont of Eucomonympha sp.]